MIVSNMLLNNLKLLIVELACGTVESIDDCMCRNVASNKVSKFVHELILQIA